MEAKKKEEKAKRKEFAALEVITEEMLNDEKKTFEKKIDAVDSTVKENVKSMEEVFIFSVSFEIFRGV